MKRKYFLTEHEGNFYLNGFDVTDLWYNFFSGLTMEQESHCLEIFIKRYAKKLVEINSPQSGGKK
jgi:hypothetical protein